MTGGMKHSLARISEARSRQRCLASGWPGLKVSFLKLNSATSH